MSADRTIVQHAGAAKRRQPSEADPGGLTVTPAKRVQVLVACNECRRHKAKCDSVRPCCGRCGKYSSKCVYDVEPGLTRTEALKKSYDAAQDELQNLRRLFDSIRACPDSEVHNLIQDIRYSATPLDAIRHIQERNHAVDRMLPKPQQTAAMLALDAHALRNADIKVPARPWTSVAGDGIISHLISQFFELEQPFLTTTVDREVFLNEMVEADIDKAEFCTPLLVNAICALSSFASVHGYPPIDATHSSLRESFFNEARKLLDIEAGKPSVPTAQALALMFLYCSGDARDRAGIAFRLAAAEMYQRLHIGDAAVPVIGSRYSQDMLLCLFSRAAWGLFCQETKICFGYNQRSLIKPPKIPRHFAGPRKGQKALERDLDFLLDSHCKISLHLYQMSLLSMGGPVSAGDIEQREQLRDRLDAWSAELPSLDCYLVRCHRYYHYLRSLYFVAMILLIRPLRSSKQTPPPSFDDPAQMLLTQCEDVASELHLWEMSYPRDFSRASGLTIWLYYLPAFTLLLLLDTHPRAHKPFVQSCRFFHNTSRHWPACDAVLKGLKAVSQQTGTTLPQACELYLEGANKDGKLDDFPLTWRVMEETEMTEILSDDARDSEPIGVELGLLISRWSAHSLN